MVCLEVEFRETPSLVIQVSHDGKSEVSVTLFKQNQHDAMLDYGIYYYEGWNFNSGNYLFTTDTK